MDFNVAKKTITRITARMSILLVIISGLLLSNIILALALSWVAIDRPRTIIPILDRSVVVTNSQVDASYLEQLSLFFVNERLNVTPETVDQNHALLLQYTASGFSRAFRQVLDEEATAIKSGKISSAFYVTSVKTNPHALTADISGTLKRWVGDRALESAEKHYRVHYEYHFGRPWIVSFEEFHSVSDGASL